MSSDTAVEKRPTQIQQMLACMEAVYPDYVCATQFNDMGIYRYGARFFEMRKMGLNIEQERCDNAWHHHSSNIDKYRYAGSRQAGSIAIGEDLFEAFR